MNFSGMIPKSRFISQYFWTLFAFKIQGNTCFGRLFATFIFMRVFIRSFEGLSTILACYVFRWMDILLVIAQTFFGEEIFVTFATLKDFWGFVRKKFMDLQIIFSFKIFQTFLALILINFHFDFLSFITILLIFIVW